MTKWSDHVVFCAFWFTNVLLARVAQNVWHRNFQKWSEHVVICIDLYWFVHFDLQMCFWLQRRAIFPYFSTSQLQKVVWDPQFLAFWLQNVLLATAACNFSIFFSSPLDSYLRTRRFTEVTFRPSRHTIHWKTQHVATSLTIRACGSSFLQHCFVNCPYCRKLDF